MIERHRAIFMEAECHVWQDDNIDGWNNRLALETTRKKINKQI